MCHGVTQRLSRYVSGIMSVSTPLLDTIEPDEAPIAPPRSAGNASSQNAMQTVVLTPSHRTSNPAMATTQSDAESGGSLIARLMWQYIDILMHVLGIAGIFRQVQVILARAAQRDSFYDVSQSSHPLALFFLYFFRIAAVSVYILCTRFTDNYVLAVSLLRSFDRGYPDIPDRQSSWSFSLYVRSSPSLPSDSCLCCC